MPMEAGATLGVGTSASSVRTDFSANAGRQQGPGMLSEAESFSERWHLLPRPFGERVGG